MPAICKQSILWPLVKFSTNNILLSFADTQVLVTWNLYFLFYFDIIVTLLKVIFFVRKVIRVFLNLIEENFGNAKYPLNEYKIIFQVIYGKIPWSSHLWKCPEVAFKEGDLLEEG